MTTFPGSPKVVKGGIALLDPQTSAVLRIIALQYNPKTLSRSFQIQGAGEEGTPSGALRLTGPPVETLTVEADLDATDQLELGDETAATLGLQPQLAALETLIYPESSRLVENNGFARSGMLEITPMETPLALFIWSEQRVLPVRVTELSVTEEAFDPLLNPIRAKVSLGLRVLSVDDLGFEHKGGNLFLVYHQLKERLASTRPSDPLSQLGLRSLP